MFTLELLLSSLGLFHKEEGLTYSEHKKHLRKVNKTNIISSNDGKNNNFESTYEISILEGVYDPE